MSTTPIADHAFLSDRHSCALIDRAGSVEWLCFPRFDGPAVFARLLDDDAGHWQVRPEAGWTATRRYAGRSLALETTFRTGDGELVLTDALGLGPDNARAPPGHRRPARAGPPAGLHGRLDGRARGVPAAPGVRAHRPAARRTWTAASPRAAAPTGWC